MNRDEICCLNCLFKERSQAVSVPLVPFPVYPACSPVTGHFRMLGSGVYSEPELLLLLRLISEDLMCCYCLKRLWSLIFISLFSVKIEFMTFISLKSTSGFGVVHFGNGLFLIFVRGLDNNYCRNPDNERMPWCYTTDPETRWEYCRVPRCGNAPRPGRTAFSHCDVHLKNIKRNWFNLLLYFCFLMQMIPWSPQTRKTVTMGTGRLTAA